MVASRHNQTERAWVCSAASDRDREGRVIPHIIAFDWKLLYATVAELGEGRNWWSLWRGCITQYHNAGTHTEAQVSALSLLYTHFQQATMDFVQLMAIDFSAALRCTCANPFSDIIADGITVSCQVSHLNLAAPYAAPSEDTELVRGSKFADRVYVNEPKARPLLRTLSAVVNKIMPRLSAIEYAELRSLLADKHEHLSAFLTLCCDECDDDGSYAPRPWARCFLRALGSDAPACIIIRVAEKPLVEHFVQHRRWREGDETAALLSLPVLWEVALHATTTASRDATLLDSVVGMFDGLLKVCFVLLCMDLSCLVLRDLDCLIM